jgi:hypothetical protein
MSAAVTTRRPHPLRELALIVALLWVYKRGRFMAKSRSDSAMEHGAFTEHSVQQLMMHSQGLMELLNRYYASVHFPATAAFFAWLLIFHPAHYRRIRNWFVVVTASGLLLHIVYPLAPPRMLKGEGFVDTLREFGPRIYSDDTSRTVANQFAAMPSLHFGWAVMVAVSIVSIKRSKLSWLAMVHPLMTLLAIVATANHYWIDAAVAFVIAGFSAAWLANTSRPEVPEVVVDNAPAELPTELPTEPPVAHRPAQQPEQHPDVFEPLPARRAELQPSGAGAPNP